MTGTGLDVFDRAVQTANVWLKELGDELHWDDRKEVYHGLRSTLHALRDRLPADEAAHLTAQLPLLVKGVVADGWRPGATPEKLRDRQAFLDRIRDDLSQAKPDADAERVARAVFALLGRHVSEGELEDVRNALPSELRGLWAEPAESGAGGDPGGPGGDG